MRRKVMVIGLDAAPPELLFNRWKDRLPVLNGLMEKGWYGSLKSTIPPITCPAWMSMVTGKDPGTLGFYGFRNRKTYNYEMSYVSSKWVKANKIWDILGSAARKCIVLGVPQTYPPDRVNGMMVSGFLTPGTEFNYTYPAGLKNEIEEVVGEYLFDVERGGRKEELDRIYQMTEKRFKLAAHFLNTREWDFFMMVEMGTDRIQHFFWEFFDLDYPAYQPGNPYRQVIPEYYQYVDSKIGEILNYVDEETLVLVVSDHGAQKMTGGFAINEWLRQKGYLALKREPEYEVPVDETEIDWKNTLAWGYGGYYGRIFLNVKGREPQGIVPENKYEYYRDKLTAELSRIKVEEAAGKVQNIIYRPEEIYQEINNIPPDLMVYFNNLEWRSIGNLGSGRYLVPVGDLKSYSANHTDRGIFISSNNRVKAEVITDVYSVILNWMR